VVANSHKGREHAKLGFRLDLPRSGCPRISINRAKANAQELGIAGKQIALTVKGQARTQASLQRSQANHGRICSAITEASDALTLLNVTKTFSAGSHYQFANRLAFVWKLASLGIPTALLYLGFVGDGGLEESLKPFKDDREWQDAFASHSSSILPSKSADIAFAVGKTPSQILVRSRQVLSQSPQVVATPGGNPVRL